MRKSMRFRLAFIVGLTQFPALTNGGEELSLVERWFWEPDVAGSNPVSPTTLNRAAFGWPFSRCPPNFSSGSRTLMKSRLRWRIKAIGRVRPDASGGTLPCQLRSPRLAAFVDEIPEVLGVGQRLILTEGEF